MPWYQDSRAGVPCHPGTRDPIFRWDRGGWEEEGAQNWKWVKKFLSEFYFPQFRQFRQVTLGLTSVWRQLMSDLTWQLTSRNPSWRKGVFFSRCFQITYKDRLEDILGHFKHLQDILRHLEDVFKTSSQLRVVSWWIQPDPNQMCSRYFVCPRRSNSHGFLFLLKTGKKKFVIFFLEFRPWNNEDEYMSGTPDCLFCGLS